jgi:hypothetical protein
MGMGASRPMQQDATLFGEAAPGPIIDFFCLSQGRFRRLAAQTIEAGRTRQILCSKKLDTARSGHYEH